MSGVIVPAVGGIRVILSADWALPHGVDGQEPKITVATRLKVVSMHMSATTWPAKERDLC